MKKLIKFYKDNCSPCMQLSSILKKELVKYKVELVEINAEYSPELVSKYGVLTLPMLFVEDEDGNILASKRGTIYTPKFLNENLEEKDLHAD